MRHPAYSTGHTIRPATEVTVIKGGFVPHTTPTRLLQAGAPITHRSQQLGHADAATTLRVNAHYLQDAWRKERDQLDTQLDIPPAQPATRSSQLRRLNQQKCSRKVVSLNFASWNRMGAWLRQIDGLRNAA